MKLLQKKPLTPLHDIVALDLVGSDEPVAETAFQDDSAEQFPSFSLR